MVSAGFSSLRFFSVVAVCLWARRPARGLLLPAGARARGHRRPLAARGVAGGGMPSAEEGSGDGVEWWRGTSPSTGAPYQLAYRHVAPAADLSGGSCGGSSNNNNGGETDPHRREHTRQRPTILFCNGFRSEMSGGTKVLALEAHCVARGWGFCAFDYRGHGLSNERGAVAEQQQDEDDDGGPVLTDWISDAAAVLEGVVLPRAGSHPSVVLVGSSMGAWIAVHLAMRYHNGAKSGGNSDHERKNKTKRKRESKPSDGPPPPPVVSGILGIASAPDVFSDLWDSASQEQRREWRAAGMARLASSHAPGGGYAVPLALIEDAREHWDLLGEHGSGKGLAVSCPVGLLHGKRDREVPWTRSLALAEALEQGNGSGSGSGSVDLRWIEDGDHRLSRPGDVRAILDALDALVAEACG
ncbi:unnamed protein product [Pseudo-nitzschia multistriata]|uniref:Palmitoyl-protein thioesterase ABHD10, mitochondrial n=1 Tax=Pseudo-nitzschia multistriata TaxID=183589 RepID=A0A448ZMN9_9STRA|nr:unnamed protein product [Pseudo-nitzschia multistriata]